MDERSIDPMRYPSHDWGRMAEDPFMTVGRKDAEMRSMLCRIWTRSGGDAAVFDELIPDRGVWARASPGRSTVGHGVESFVEGWAATVERSEIPAVETLLEDIEALKKHIQAGKPDGEQIRKLLGKVTMTLAGQSGSGNTEKVETLG